MTDIHSPSLDVSGLQAIEDGFNRLEAWVESDIIKRGAKASAQMLADAAKALVPRDSGALESEIHVRAGRSSKGSFSFLSCVGSGWHVGRAFYGAFQEFGWQTGKRGSKNRQEIPGEHYMQYAGEETAQAAVDAFGAFCLREIEQELSKK